MNTLAATAPVPAKIDITEVAGLTIDRVVIEQIDTNTLEYKAGDKADHPSGVGKGGSNKTVIHFTNGQCSEI